MASNAQGKIAVGLALLAAATMGFQWTTTVYKKRPAPVIVQPRISTYYGQAFGATDSASTDGPGPQSITPPANMKAGDLTIVFGINRSANVEISLSGAGGQTWDSTAPIMRAASNSGQLYFCEYDGTWDANPSVQSASGTTGLIAGMYVFRPADSSLHSWSLESADTARYTGTTVPSITAKSTVSDSTVAFAVIYSQDDNSWNNQTGTSWTRGFANYGYQNVSGSDLSCDILYQLKTGAGALGAVVDTQRARGDDAGGWIRVVIK